MQHCMQLIKYLVKFCGLLKPKEEFWATGGMISLTIISRRRWLTMANCFLERETVVFTHLIYPTANFFGALRQTELFTQRRHYITIGCLLDPLTEIFTLSSKKRVI